jgi:hypothetical protein
MGYLSVGFIGIAAAGDVAMGLGTPEVVGTLEALGLLNLDDPGPWPGEPENESAWPVDWAGVEEPTGPEPTLVVDDVEYGIDRAWGAVRDELLSRAGRGRHVPPPDVLDALAWYLPIHNFGSGWGIYIRESAVLMLAGAVLSRVDPARRGEPDAIYGAVRAGLAILYLHEAFHHKAESFAIRLEIVEHTRRHQPYFRGVYAQLRAAGSDELLEGALACAEIMRCMHRETVYRNSIPDYINVRAQRTLWHWFPTLPPGYRTALDYVNDEPFEEARNLLSSQIHEGRQHPMRRHEEWHLMPDGYNTLLDCRPVTHILVPHGATPIIPWFGKSPVPLSMSTDSMVRLALGEGYAIVPGAGKGSHIKLHAEGRPMIILPANRKSLSLKVLSSVATALR